MLPILWAIFIVLIQITDAYSFVAQGHFFRTIPPKTTHFGVRMAKPDSLGENNFGDIMGSNCITENIIESGEFSPMERVVLTANGNLQRIMSSYYGANVRVVILECSKVEDKHYSREVDLVVGDRRFCKATGRVEIFSDECVTAMEAQKIGLGQLFRYFGVLPAFKLIDVGREENGKLFRVYELECPQLKCTFREVFELDMWAI
jgi:hypothetical protein